MILLNGFFAATLCGSTLGRADSISTQAPAGAYVLPADVVAGLGQGNSLAGARVWNEILSSGPWGTPKPQQHGGRGAPRAPAVSATTLESKGGRVEGTAGTVPVMLSHGEIVVEPQDVQRIGDGDLKRGHRTLDAFVLRERQKHIKKLKALPGPVKS